MVLYTLTTAMADALEMIQSVKQIPDVTTSRSLDVSVVEKLGNVEQQHKKCDNEMGNIEYNAWKEDGNTVSKESSARQKAPDGFDPSLSNLKPGDPISHRQIIDLWKATKTRKVSSLTLDTLMRGSRIYVAPSKPKQEPACPLTSILKSFVLTQHLDT